MSKGLAIVAVYADGGSVLVHNRGPSGVFVRNGVGDIASVVYVGDEAPGVMTYEDGEHETHEWGKGEPVWIRTADNGHVSDYDCEMNDSHHLGAGLWEARTCHRWTGAVWLRPVGEEAVEGAWEMRAEAGLSLMIRRDGEPTPWTGYIAGMRFGNDARRELEVDGTTMVVDTDVVMVHRDEEKGLRIG